MQFTANIPESGVGDLLNAVFVDNAKVYEAYSRPENVLREFNSVEVITTHIQTERAAGESFFNFSVHYPEAKGLVKARTINLDPVKCNGATWRQAIDGWGLIQLQLRFVKDGVVESNIAVNSEKRATGWADTLPQIGSPALWDWKTVEKHARRLIRLLRRGR